MVIEHVAAVVAAHAADGNVDIVALNALLSPVQQRNLEKAWGVKILDRTVPTGHSMVCAMSS